MLYCVFTINLVVPNVKVRMQAQRSVPLISLNDLLRTIFTIFYGLVYGAVTILGRT
jgi:hypothetical protein